MNRGRVRAWIGYEGAENPGWTGQATAWLNEVATAVRNAAWDSATGLNSFSREEDATGRVEEQYTLGGADTLLETVINGARVRLQDETLATEYMSDGATEIGRWDRALGWLRIKRTENGTPTFGSGWVDLGGVFASVKWYKDANGFVHLEGIAQNTSGVTRASGTAALNLPLGCRPLSRRVYTTRYSSGSDRVDIDTGGNVLIQISVVTTGWVSVSGLSFFAGH